MNSINFINIKSIQNIKNNKYNTKGKNKVINFLMQFNIILQLSLIDN